MADYVDNKKLTERLGKWALYVRAQESMCEIPIKITPYIAECIYLICNNMGYKSSFINYTYKDDMIGDAIENCIRYVKNFDISKNNNAFGYVSTIAYYAFIRKIKKENKRHIDHLLYIRKVFTEDDVRDAIDADNPNDVKDYTTYIDHMQSILDDMNVEVPEQEKKKKKKKKKKTLFDSALTGEEY